MPGSPQYAPLSDAEQQWLQQHLDHGVSLGLDADRPSTVSEFFDSSCEGVRSGDRSPEDGNTVVNLVAVFLGEHLLRSSALSWAIVTDEYGTDLCLKGRSSSVVLFPQSTTAKRWAAGETGWVVPFLGWAKQQVAERP